MNKTAKKWLALALALPSLAVAPALAQQSAQPGVQGGLPAVQDEVNALRGQAANLQQQMYNLQQQIDALNALLADDGTAQALVGTWTGRVNNVEFLPSTGPSPAGTLPNVQQFFYLSGPSSNGPTTIFQIPTSAPCPGGGVCSGSFVNVSVNPDFWLVRGPGQNNPPDTLTFSILRDDNRLTGTFTGTGDSGDLSGIVVSNNFFLLRVRVQATGQCAPSGFVIFQGTGSLSQDRTRMTVTGSGILGDCKHSLFRVALTKQ